MSINSIRNLVEIANAKTPTKIAITDKNSQLSYEEVYEKVNKLSHYITTLNLEKGSRIGVYANKNIQNALAILSILSTDYVLVPISKLLKAEQVEHIINDCDISCIITDEQKLKTLQETSFDKKIITVETCDKDLVSFEEIYKCYSSEYDCSIKGHDNAVITYSFASSGFPKGVVISHKNLIDSARVVNNYLDISEDDVLSGLLSFSFDYGLNQMFASFYARATFSIYTFFTPSDFFAHLLKNKITILACMPIHFSMMFDEDSHRLPSPTQLENVRVITSSGGNVTTSMIEQNENYFTKAQFYSMSGHTEAFRSAYLCPSQLKIRPNSIGKAIPDVDLYVINEEGYECKPREVGQLIHRGAGIYKGFWNSQEDTDHSFKSIKILEKVLNLQNGLIDEVVVATGDYVYKDEEGYIYFVSRNDDMIKTSGYRISPLEIETVVYNNIQEIKECAVYNHYKRIFKQSTDEDLTELTKSNVLLIGPTGSGKTLLAQTIAKYLDVPLAIADATSLTEAGYVGDDVENVVTRLIQAADGDIQKAEQGIIFIDEIDKIARMSENRSITRDVSGEGVQQALLKIVEGSLVNVPPKGGRKHPGQDSIQLDTTNVLFICGGAFDGMKDIIGKREGGNILGFNQEKKTKNEQNNIMEKIESDDLVKYGLIPELIGRLHMTAILEEIDEEAMIHILKEPKNSLVKQYKKLFKMDDVNLEFDDKSLVAIAKAAIDRKTGARGLRSILEDIMLDVMYELPEYKGKTITITEDVVNKTKLPQVV